MRNPPRVIVRLVLGAALLITAVALLVASRGEGIETRHVVRGAVGLDVPLTWTVTNFSVDPTPPRLVAASFPVADEDVAGDCGGLAAVTRLPSDGALVVLIDYGPFGPDIDHDDFNEEAVLYGRDDPFSPRRLAEFACFGRSYAFVFLSGGRALQAHVGLGEEVTPVRRREARALLDSIEVESP